jgi:hypothetical protein
MAVDEEKPMGATDFPAWQHTRKATDSISGEKP